MQLARHADQEHPGCSGFQQQHQQEDKNFQGWRTTLQNEGIVAQHSRFYSHFLNPFYLQVDRTGTKVTVVEQKVNKDYTFQENILDLCVECLERGVVPTSDVSKGYKIFQ